MLRGAGEFHDRIAQTLSSRLGLSLARIQLGARSLGGIAARLGLFYRIAALLRGALVFGGALAYRVIAQHEL